MFDPYQELDVSRTASINVVKAAYREKSRKAHPDAGGTAEKFVRISRAYAILKDPDRRSAYDARGDTADRSSLNDNVDVVAMTLISEIVGALLRHEHIDITRADVSSAIVIELQNKLRQIRSARTKMGKIVERCKRAEQQLHVRGNAMQRVVVWHRQEAEAAAARLADDMLKVERAIAIAGDRRKSGKRL